jgi:glutathione-regulated potassium-efflux system ancillary protein KefG
MNTLVIVAHPDMENSRINKILMNGLGGMGGVTIHQIYEDYPDYKIDVKKEQNLLRKADAIVFQFPFYWYSVPPLLKKWMDDVLEYGFAYGSKGTALKGKKFFIVTSTGGPAEAYAHGGYNHFTISELLRPFEQTANLTQMAYMEPFVVHGARTISDDELEKRKNDYRKLIAGLK